MVDRKTSINITSLTVIIFGCLIIFTVRVRVRMRLYFCALYIRGVRTPIEH